MFLRKFSEIKLYLLLACRHFCRDKEQLEAFKEQNLRYAFFMERDWKEGAGITYIVKYLVHKSMLIAWTHHIPDLSTWNKN